ncbi:hypothetical protein GCM10010409_32840 [Mycolicibacterium diernhoferi]
MTPRIPTRRLRLFAVVIASVVSVAGLCTGGAHAWHDRTEVTYYVSVGDSYAAGYRPDGKSGLETGDGYAYQLTDILNRSGRWELRNFGCVGQTAHGMQLDNGCTAGALASGGVDYPETTQLRAADTFMAEHQGEVGLVTVAMGANDMVRCLDLADDGAVQHCAEQMSTEVRQSLGVFLTATRALLGNDVPIVGISYFNVFHAAGPAGPLEASRRSTLSQTLFDNYLNPTLRDIYSQAGAYFVDSSTIAGNDLPESRMSPLPGHGTVSTSTARLCGLTYYCSDHDPHPNRAGHALIAQAIAEAIT